MTPEKAPHGNTRLVDDGFGNLWETCGDDCDLQIVRPGKVQCSGKACGMDDDGAWSILCELSDP